MATENVYFRNSVANWIGYGSKLVVLFFLSPFVVHSLGNTAYGVWCLLMSIVGYMGLLEMGVMTSTARYVNYYLAVDDREGLNRIVNTSLLFYSGASLCLFIVVSVGGPYFGRMFNKVLAEFGSDVQLILYIFCGNIFLGFVSAILRQLLAGRNRFDLLNLGGLIVLAITTVGTVLALNLGYGIVGLAVIHLAGSVVGCVLLFCLAKVYGPAFEIGIRYLRRSAFKEFFYFSVFAFIIDVGTQLIFYSDSVVIGIFMGATAITIFNIPLLLIEHGRNVIKQVRNAITPDLLKIGGAGNIQEAKQIVIRFTRFIMFFAVPLLVGFVAFGKEFISLWMGQGFEESYAILVLLALPQFGSIAGYACSIFLIGMGEIRPLALIVLAEGVVNLLLSVLLAGVLHMGIKGVALGTMIPMLLFSGLIVPMYTCRRLHVSYTEFADETIWRWLKASVFFGAICFLVSYIQLPWSWANFCFRVVLSGICYIPIGILVLLNEDERTAVLKHPKDIVLRVLAFKRRKLDILQRRTK